MSNIMDFLCKEEKEQEIRERRQILEEKQRQHEESIQKLIKQEINFPGFDGKLDSLVEAIRTIPNYNNLKGYIRHNILPKNVGIDYKELSIISGVHQGVALVILYDLYADKMEQEVKELEEAYYSCNEDDEF